MSRADVVALTLLCRNKNVIEYGCGGSTIILSKIATNVISFDTDQNWIDKIKPQVGKNVEFHYIVQDEKLIPDIIGTWDVFLDDGWAKLRGPMLLKYWPQIRECALLHDARMTYPGNVVKQFLDAFTIKNDPSEFNPGLKDNPYLGSLKSIEWDYLESNMAVLFKRNCTLLYENWNESEKGNHRVPW